MFITRANFRYRLREAQLRRNVMEKIQAYLAFLTPKMTIGQSVAEARKRGLNVSFQLVPKTK